MVKNLPVKAGDSGDMGLIPGLGRFPGVGNGHLLQYSCLKNSMDRGAWRATIHEVTKELDNDRAEHTCMLRNSDEGNGAHLDEPRGTNEGQWQVSHRCVSAPGLCHTPLKVSPESRNN